MEEPGRNDDRLYHSFLANEIIKDSTTLPSYRSLVTGDIDSPGGGCLVKQSEHGFEKWMTHISHFNTTVTRTYLKAAF